MSRPNRRPLITKDNATNTGAGIVLGKVKRIIDVEYNQQLEVEIITEGAGSFETPGQLVTCKYMSPFYGVTGQQYVDKNNDYDGTQKSYGMWVPTPDIGSQVIVIYIEGNPKNAFWIGCVPERYKNFMVPGYAATEINVEYGAGTRVPTVEFNSLINERPSDDATNVSKPTHNYFYKALQNQGLDKDDIRGITTSSARRESPSRVFGISTPGPLDKNGPKGPVGTTDDETDDQYISRLGGSSFVMDDGDSKYTRQTKADAGPPIYKYVFDDNSGDPTVPHNELIRLRTRTGHQILLHNSEDLIYIGNAKGTAWVELTSNGKIDIFAADSISIRSQADVNIKADRDINFEAGRNINMKAVAGRMQIETKTNFNLIVGADGFITTTGNLQINTGKLNNFTSKQSTNINSNVNINMTSGQDINVKATAKYTQNAAAYYSLPGAGGTAAVTAIAAVATTAKVLPTITLPDVPVIGSQSTVSSILPRMPSLEPYAHHENLDPLQFTTDKTDRETTPSYTTPTALNTYSTPTDTFKQGKGDG